MNESIRFTCARTCHHPKCAPIYAAMFNGVPDKLVFQALRPHQFIFADGLWELPAPTSHDAMSFSNMDRRRRVQFNCVRREEITLVNPAPAGGSSQYRLSPLAHVP